MTRAAPATTELPDVRTWVDGVEHPLTEAEWAERLLTCLGCAFRVTVPAGREDDAAWWWARDRARQVADRFGAHFDEEPWREPGDQRLGWEAYGLWEHRFRAPLGAATTRVAALPPLGDDAERTARAVVLPFPYGSRAALAGLSVPLPHEEHLAARHVASRDADVGLWVDHTGELCTSTAGPLLLHTSDGAWLHPRPESGAVPTWSWQALVTARGSHPTLFRPADLATARAWAVGPTGQVTELLI